MSIYLASQSPRRRELLTQIGVQHDVISVEVEESRSLSESALDYVSRLSYEKAKAGCKLVADHPVLGADTVVVLGSDVLEKPCSEEEGVAMLLRLSGQTHQVFTSVSVVYEAQHETRTVTSLVKFRVITYHEAQQYWQTKEPQDKAGGYGIQGLGAVFVESIQGSYSGIVGLPLFETSQLLSLFGIKVWR